MLVYSNYLKAIGTNAKGEVLRAVGGWLKEHLGYTLSPDKLITAGEYSGKRDVGSSWVKILTASDNTQELYSWILKNNDSSVRGRQWSTEIGLKVINGVCEISCVVNTEETSTLISEPVKASRPRLIKYLVSNFQTRSVRFDTSVPGLSVKDIGSSPDTYRSFLYDIENSQRDYPIVLVAPARDNSYLINAEHLQQDLVGLAQVVRVDKDYNSYDMEEILSKRWSAWDGAVNVLHMPTSTGYVRSRVFLSEEIADWGTTQTDKISHILAWVTHNTNISRLRKRIRPEGVMRLAVLQSLNDAIDRHRELNEDQLRHELSRVATTAAEQNEWVKLLEDTNDSLEDNIQRLNLDLDEKKDELSKDKQIVIALKAQLRNSGANTATVDTEHLLSMLTRADSPEPAECLKLIEAVYSDRCEVLESAKESAKESNRFEHSKQLLDLLIRLVTKYRETLMCKGDSEARKAFGNNEFSPKESEPTMANPILRRLREFEYQGARIEMFRHLKIGISDDLEKTIRVHFHWDHARKMIVIGYCGKHLPISSH